MKETRANPTITYSDSLLQASVYPNIANVYRHDLQSFSNFRRQLYNFSPLLLIMFLIF